MNHILYFLLFIGLFCASSCRDKTPLDSQINVSAEEVQEIADANLAFSWDLFRKTNEGEEEGKNILLSPVSVQTALHMAINGAQGETQSQIKSILHVNDLSVAKLNQVQAKWTKTLQDQQFHPKITITNALFSDPTRIALTDSYTKTLDEYYNASSMSRDFSHSATKSFINNWVKDRTKGKIEGIVDRISPDDIAFLINALYFQADWANGFNPMFTRPGSFHRHDGTSVEIDFIYSDRWFTYTQQSDFEAVDIPFKDSTYSMTLMQPNRDIVGVNEWITQLTSSFLSELYPQMQYGRAQLQFPVLDLEYKRQLKKDLQLLGMEDAFSPSDSDFGAMGTSLIGPNVYVSRIVHKTALKVDEKGAEGAAATSIGVSTTSLPPRLVFNESFILVVRHIPTNSIIFIGKVEDPAQ